LQTQACDSLSLTCQAHLSTQWPAAAAAWIALVAEGWLSATDRQTGDVDKDRLRPVDLVFVKLAGLACTVNTLHTVVELCYQSHCIHVYILSAS